MSRRLLLLVAFALVSAAVAHAQSGTTTVTAVVRDANNAIYSNCQWSVVFVGENTTPGAGPYLPDSYTQGQQGVCDGSGNLGPIQLGDNINTITPVPSQWSFSICSGVGYPGGVRCKSNILITITGTSQDISSTLQPLLPLLPILNGGCLNAVCASLSGNNAFTGSNTFTNIASATFSGAATFNNLTTFSNTGNFTNVLPITNGMTSIISGCNPNTNFGVQGGKGYTNAFVGCTDMPNGATNQQSNGVAAYVTTVADSRVINPGVIGGGPNAVAFYGTMEVNGNYAAGWASNLVLACGGGASTTAMKCIGNETDVQYNGGNSLLGTAGAIEPMLITGNAIGAAIPVNATHPALNSMYLGIQTGVTCSGCPAGSGPWPYGYSAYRGLSQRAFFAGATCFTSYPCGSQNFTMESYDASGNRRESNIGATQDGDIYLFPQAGSNRVLEIPGAGGGLTLSQINALSNLVNGMVAFCGDCTNTPGGHTAGAICAGSGTGAMAVRENGQWNCF